MSWTSKIQKEFSWPPKIALESEKVGSQLYQIFFPTDSDDSDNESESKVNKCSQVWQGMVQQRCFSELKFKQCPTESMAREQFRKHGVEHYWALAHGQRILEATEDV